MRSHGRIFLSLQNGINMTGNSNNPSVLWMLAACLILDYLLPYHMYPFMAFYNEWLVFLGVTGVLALFSEQKTIPVRLPWLAIIPAGLAVVIIIQTLLGLLTDRWDAILPIAYLLGATVAILLGATISAQPQGSQGLCKALAWAHLVAGLVSVGLATLQLVGKEALLLPFIMLMRHDVAIRPYANIGQFNQLALLFCLSLASVWWLYQIDKLRSSIAIGMALLLLWGLTLPQSRIGWIIIPLFALFAWLWRRNTHFKQIPSPLIATLVTGYFCGVIALPTISSLLGAITMSAAEHVGTGSTRLVLLQQALEISLSHPWFGAGWYEFGPQQVQIGADFAPGNYAQHAHNIVMNFAAELGWPVTIAVFAPLGYWFYRCCLRPGQQKPLSKEVGFATLFFIAVLVHSLVEFPLWFAYVLIPTAFLLGMVHQEQLGTRAIQVARAYPLVLFLIMALALVGVATDYRRVVLGFRALGWENLGLKADEGSTEPPAFTLFPQFYDYFRFAKTTAHAGMSSEDIAFMEHVAKRFGYAPVLMRMSFVYALNDRPDDAVRAMTTLMKLHTWLYPEAYQSWKSMAKEEPEKYACVFKQLEPSSLDEAR
jgi:Virulence factor membrane-bound polymerase, C-terminal/O-Antigen ligase